MAIFKKLVALAALAMVVFGLASCERKITRIVEVQTAQNCFDCHNDNNTALVAAELQWNNSIHASGNNIDRDDSTCKNCHTSEGFVGRAEGTPVPDRIEGPTAIHCFTCHAPHTTGGFGLRWTSTAVLANGASFDLKSGNLCVACHQARRNVDTYVSGSPSLTSRWGPHLSVQGDMLIGSNGYHYSGFTYEQTKHRSATRAGCIDCHMKTTSNNVVGGHALNMRYDTGSEEIVNTEACDVCHDPINDFRDAGFGFSLQDSVDALTTQLEGILTTAGLWNNGAPRSVKTSADSAGAVWNLLMVEEDRSHGIHNPRYALSLLRSSIQYMQGSLPQVRMYTSRD